MTLPRAQDVKTIAVLGFGVMGHTWTTALLAGGLDVVVYEANAQNVESNTNRVRKYLERMVQKGVLEEDVERAMQRLQFVESEEALAKCGAQALLEVIFEDLDLKCATFERISAWLSPETLVWSNTSCLDVEKMAMASGRPDRFVGTHGMNPVHLTKGVEIVRHPQLAEQALDCTLGVMQRIDKAPFVTDNVPGFIVNNGLIPWMIHYYLMLERGQATTLDIDTALRTSLGHPQGVFMLHDYVGTNTMVLVSEALYEATLDPRYKLPRFIHDMRDAGHMGFSSGRGFYDWRDPKNPEPIAFAELS
ncbi:MAG: 3-hydroxyacyl-CoA dehydrogenase family protein [Gammaproteobacteria bacterium]|nr:3-hydroxyacyl-CoA dehydrogenase family protein [Gammaproteobacteria bacterium]